MDHKKIPTWSSEKHSIEYDHEDFEFSLPNLARDLKDKKETNFMSIGGVFHENIQETGEEELPNDNESIYDKDLEGASSNSSLPKSPLNKVQKKLTPEEQRELTNPAVEDFLRRCRTREECDEIISYMVKNKDINLAKAKELKDRIEKEGIHCFGPKKSWGYYERKYRNNNPAI